MKEAIATRAVIGAVLIFLTACAPLVAVETVAVDAAVEVPAEALMMLAP